MDFVLIANAWEAGIANPTSKHRIALELARRGHRVLWVEGGGMRSPRLDKEADRTRMRRRLAAALRGVRRAPEVVCTEGGVWILTPLLVPLPSVAAFRFLNGMICAWTARAAAWRLRFRAPMLIHYVPVLATALKGWPWRKVYYCVDRWDAFRMYNAAVMAKADAQCCRWADVVIASSRALYERCRQLNPRTHLVLHGVDHAHFARALHDRPRPADLPRGPVAGFFGLLSEWLDQDLVAHVARDLPDVQIVLIGDRDVPMDRLRGIPNLHLLGSRPFWDLPDYAGWFDVGLIPFLVNDLTKAVNPIKLREMLSAGCPVVATDLPEVASYIEQKGNGEIPAGAVCVAKAPEEFVALVRDRLAAPAGREERQRISAVVAGETWAAKVDELLAAAGEKEEHDSLRVDHQ